MKVWLLDLDALDELDAPQTVRVSSGGYTAGPHLYEPVLQSAPLFTVHAQGSPLNWSAKSGIGQAVMSNLHGGLNYLESYAFDGRTATLKLATTAGVITVLTGTLQGLSFDDGKVVATLLDPQRILDRPHPHVTYAGTNALPAGVEGTAADLKGQRKPRCYGKPRNAALKLVNTAQLIYQVCDQSGTTIGALYDRAVLLTDNGEEADLAALIAASPGPGEYARWRGYVKLGSRPVGELTADVDCALADAGDVFEQIAAEAGFDVAAGAVTALNTAGEVGFQLMDAPSTADLLSRISRSACGYWAINADGDIEAALLAAPAAPEFDVEMFESSKPRRPSTGAGANGLPVYRVVMNADPVEVVQSEVAAAADAERAARVAARYRTAAAEDAPTLTRHPLSPEILVDTVLRDLGTAQTKADALLDLIKVRRDTVIADCYLDDVQIELMRIGAVMRLHSRKLNYPTGRVLLITGYLLNLKAGTATLYLWG